MKHIFVLFMLSLFLILPLASLGEASPMQAEGDYLYMINVGKGDAILIRASGKYYLIDAAKAGKWDDVEAALSECGVSELEGVFLTHTDKDHTGGLKKLVKSDIVVKNWYASAYYTCELTDHPMVKALKKTDAEIVFLKEGDRVDSLFTVLSPILPDEDNDDNNSLVMMFDNGACRALLCGDMESREEYRLLESGHDLSCDLFKVPNHADDDVCLYMDLSSLGAKVALISTDPYEKPGTPDAYLVSRLESAGMAVFCTDYTQKGILVTLDEALTVTEK